MRTFTYQDIIEFDPCYDPSTVVPTDWEGSCVDFLNLESVPFQDRIWLVCRIDFLPENRMRQFAAWCAEQMTQTNEVALAGVETAKGLVTGACNDGDRLESMRVVYDEKCKNVDVEAAKLDCVLAALVSKETRACYRASMLANDFMGDSGAGQINYLVSLFNDFGL